MDRSRAKGESLSLQRPDFPLAEESPLALVVNQRKLALLMCTPLNLDELALGHLFGRGLIEGPGSLKSLWVCPDRGSVHVETLEPLPETALPDEAFLPSACGSGVASAELLGAPARQPLASGWTIGLEELKKQAREMFSRAVLYKATGGIHCAALLQEAEEGGAFSLEVREDVGRHNAVDKVIGFGLFAGADFSRSAILTSGRVAADMVLKARAAGIPVLATRSIPTSSAYALALEAGITIVGRIGAERPIVYTRPERIR